MSKKAPAPKSVNIDSPELAKHPVAIANAESWPAGGKKKAPAAAAAQVAEAIAKAAGTSKISAAAQAAAALGLGKPLLTKYVDPRLIDRREGWNPRIDFGEIDLLAASIRTEKAKDGHGLINDIRVKSKPGGRYELVDGDRRLSAVELLLKRGEEFSLGIPCKVERADAGDQDLLIRMFTANTGKPFTPIEQAMAFKRLRDGDPELGTKGMTIKQIEKATGCSDNSIVGALALLDADADLQAAVKSGEIGATLAKSIAVNARGDLAKQAELTRAAKAAGKDKTAQKAVKKAVDDSRRAKAAKRGLTLKIRALSDADLSAMGAAQAETLVVRLAECELDVDTDIRKLIKSDARLALAATFGAFEALKAAAGLKVGLEF